MDSLTTAPCSVSQCLVHSVLLSNNYPSIALGVSNLILLSALPITRAGLSPALTPVLRCSYSIIGSRIILNLRGAASHLNQDKSQRDIRLVELSGSSSSASQQESRVETLVPSRSMASDPNAWRLTKRDVRRRENSL